MKNAAMMLHVFLAVYLPLVKNIAAPGHIPQVPHCGTCSPRKWIHVIRGDPGINFTLGQTTKVCSKHFTPDDFVPNVASGRLYLKDSAVPSVFPFSKVVSRPRPTKHLQERNLRDNSELVYTHLAPSGDDAENADHQCPSSTMDNAAPENACILQGRICCSC